MDSIKQKAKELTRWLGILQRESTTMQKDFSIYLNHLQHNQTASGFANKALFDAAKLNKITIGAIQTSKMLEKTPPGLFQNVADHLIKGLVNNDFNLTSEEFKQTMSKLDSMIVDQMFYAVEDAMSRRDMFRGVVAKQIGKWTSDPMSQALVDKALKVVIASIFKNLKEVPVEKIGNPDLEAALQDLSSIVKDEGKFSQLVADFKSKVVETLQRQSKSPEKIQEEIQLVSGFKLPFREQEKLVASASLNVVEDTQEWLKLLDFRMKQVSAFTKGTAQLVGQYTKQRDIDRALRYHDFIKMTMGTEGDGQKGKIHAQLDNIKIALEKMLGALQNQTGKVPIDDNSKEQEPPLNPTEAPTTSHQGVGLEGWTEDPHPFNRASKQKGKNIRAFTRNTRRQ